MLYGITPSKDCHQALEVQGAVVLKNIGLTAADHAASIWLCQVGSSTGLNVVVNAGSAAAATLGFYYSQYQFFTLTQPEMQTATLYSAGTSTLQIAGGYVPPFPHQI